MTAPAPTPVQRLARIMMRGPIVDFLEYPDAKPYLFLDERRVVLLESDWNDIKAGIVALFSERTTGASE